ncbi:MAG: phospholipase D-like domain-containing protein [Bacteroidia bacterium]
MTNQLFKKNYFKSKENYAASDLKLVHSGDDYFDRLIQMIDSCKHTLLFQTYIFEEDETGKKIAAALKKASQRGVVVALLLDGFGSKNLSTPFINELKNTGIDIRFFAPLFSTQSIYLGRRMHHKIIVADQQKALIGGINIANKYRGNSTEPAWLDYAVYIEGKVCIDLNRLCLKMYGFKNRLIRSKIEQFTSTKKQVEFTLNETNYWIKIKQNDRLKGKNQITQSYLKAIKNAKSSIYITGSYFLPGRRLRNALINASKRGVEVNLILAGVSDVPLFKNATAWLYDLLFRNKINIYEWNKSVLHGKVAIIDNNWTTIGSFNLNHLSAYGSIELNIDTANEAFISKFKQHILTVIQEGCERVVPEKQNNSLFARLKRWLAYKGTRSTIKVMVVFPYINPFKRFE